ncbi:MAG: 4Fe-4S binding protein [Planctomycetota bacterium]
MAHKIIETCVSCGACEAECPVQAISQGETIYIIDPVKCSDCGACVEICPVQAIVKPE